MIDKTIFLNETTGEFSYKKSELFVAGRINFTEILNNFKVSVIYICLCISNKCNMNCSYCFNQDKDNKVMDFKFAKSIIEKAIDENKYCDKFFIDVSGSGEPLLNLNLIWEINNLCKKLSNKINKEIILNFVTNGLLLTEKISTKLQSEGILFGISLDGDMYNHNFHRKSNGHNTYELIMENIRKIKNNDYLGVAVTISNTVFDLVKTIDDLSLYFNTISIKPIRHKELGFNRKITKLWILEYQKLTRNILILSDNNNISILKKLLNGDDYFGKFIYRAFMGVKTLNRCDSGISRFCYDIDGTLYGCPPAKVYPEERLIKPNNLQKYKKQIQDTINMCSGCSYLLLCGGQCQIETLINNGKLNNNMCLFKKKLIDFAMYISLYIKQNNKLIYKEIIEFCNEKNERSFRNDELLKFVKENNYSFIEGKKIYDKLNKKY